MIEERDHAVCGICRYYRAVSCGIGVCTHKNSPKSGHGVTWTHKGCKKFYPK